MRWIPFSLLHSWDPTRGGERTTELEGPSPNSLALSSSASLSSPSRSSQMKVASSVISSMGGRGAATEPRQQEETGAGMGIGREFSTGGATYSSGLDRSMGEFCPPLVLGRNELLPNF